MTSYRSLSLGVFALVSLSACGASAPPRSAYASLPTTRGARQMVEMTDIEEVRDVLRSGTTTYVATDNGVLVFAGEGTPTRIGREQGLPSLDVTALALESDGAILIATNRTLSRLVNGQATAVEGAPPVARIVDLAIMQDGSAWACSLSGLAHRGANGWEIMGESFPCTTLAPTPEGSIWAGSATGLYYIEGDVVREHPISGGIPEGYVRSIVPVLPGQVLTLLSGPSRSMLGFYDGTKWHAYTLPGVTERVVGLTSIEGTGTVLVTEERTYAIVPTGGGTAFRAISSHDATSRSFRVEMTPAAQATAAADVSASDVLRAPQPLADAAPEASASMAIPLFARELTATLPPGAYRTFRDGQDGYAAITNRGIVQLGERAMRPLRSASLIPEEDLQVVTDLQSGVWVRGRDGDIAKWVDGRLRRLALPEEIAPQALASGPDGAYLVALVRGTNTVRVFVASGSGFRQLVERTLNVPVVAIPFAGVGNDGRVWLGLRVNRDDGQGTRMRGAAVIDPNNEAVVYHHRGAVQAEGGLALSDEVSGMTFDGEGNAWFATLSGAVRVEAHQAITFDESRGVRGDVVMDLVTGAGNMWVASAEGLGSYANRAFDYSMPAIVREHRPVALAIDLRGTLWAAGRYGLLIRENDAWQYFGEAGTDAQGHATPGLPTAELRDVETDGQNRVWLLSGEGVTVLE